MLHHPIPSTLEKILFEDDEDALFESVLVDTFSISWLLTNGRNDQFDLTRVRAINQSKREQLYLCNDI